jgi:hypothetical protein
MVSVKVTIFHALLLLPLALAAPAPGKQDHSVTTLSDAEPSQTPGAEKGEITTEVDGSSSDGNSGSTGPTGFELSKWSLQLPIGKPGSPTTIAGSKLSGSGNKPAGFEKYFQMEDGVIKMLVPGSPEKTGCVKTKNSKHCRTEFRETSPKSWKPTASRNRLSATLTVIKADDSKHGTCIGQIHIDDSVSVKPVAELYYNQQGEMTFGVEQTRSGGNEKMIPISGKNGKIPPGTKFSYEIAYEKGELSVSINGGKKQVFSQYKLDNPLSYFKAGNYNQGESASEVHFFGIKTEH